MADRETQDGKVQEFCDMCNASPEQARQYLEATGWEMMPAVASFFQDEDERVMEQDHAPGPAPPSDDYTGPRTLDGRPAPQAAARPPRKTTAQPKKKGIATLGSIGGSSHQHDDDDHDDDLMDDDEDDEGRGNLFAGGEKSGLAVQDPQKEGGPRKIISDILAKAKANASRQDPASGAGPSRSTHFHGAGMTLGGEGVESRSIPGPHGSRRTSNAPPQERILHIWQDGFSVDDGELRRFDDPANQLDLQMIRSGRAPLHLMNVENDQPVDVKLHQHDTPYTPQPKKYKPFGGSGQRLGAPVPGDGNSPTVSAPAPEPSAAQSSSSASIAPTVDSAQPTINIRIQMPDGTRLPARFNTSHTLGDVYGFVQSASPETRSRTWVLATTFPNKEHTDRSLVLGDIPEFKKGGTAVVKWA
ncbi:hypothetical protein S40285_02733 [Stachybotrys chlorohalonatus IBT 40285]|uniref:UBX domain-containing protein n=1 Tax=Stachybotrys chlorohalonatus (strain IBT 40285) TaxID=1283841 RepID=A0A084QAH0_STAC4|nr:hypothetical protein S40285_02733 [Stachybotrys chlorohalonata IBT 40285]